MEKYPLTKYQIWIGSYDLGQGYSPSTEPQMIAEIEAPNFRVACVLYELRTALESIERRMKNDEYIDHQSCRWFYNFETNSNSWTGKYFQTKDEALNSFKRVGVV
jgi:hypothetical protein